MSDCSQPDADGRIILHVVSCNQMGLINVYIQTNVTNVIVLFVVFMPGFLKINAGAQVIAICGIGTHKYCMSINVIAKSITSEGCKEVLFLHVLS